MPVGRTHPQTGQLNTTFFRHIGPVPTDRTSSGMKTDNSYYARSVPGFHCLVIFFGEIITHFLLPPARKEYSARLLDRHAQTGPTGGGDKVIPTVSLCFHDAAIQQPDGKIRERQEPYQRRRRVPSGPQRISASSMDKRRTKGRLFFSRFASGVGV